MRQRTTVRKSGKWQYLAIETLCLVIILSGLLHVKHEQNISRADENAYTADPDALLKQTKVQKLSGSVDDLYQVVDDQMNAMLGLTSKDTFKNMSDANSARSAIEVGLGIIPPDLMQGGALDIASNMNQAQSQIAQAMFQASAAALAAQNAKFMNDQRGENVSEAQDLNGLVKDKNEEFKERLNTEDEMSSRIGNLAPK